MPIIKDMFLKLNPSAAKRWTKCTASPGLIKEKNIKSQPSSDKSAKRGNLLHEISANLLAIDFDELYCTLEKEDKDLVDSYVSYVRTLSSGYELNVELRVNNFYQNKSCFIDACFGKPETLVVIDLKTGRHPVTVDLEEIKSLSFEKTDLQTLIYVINLIESIDSEARKDLKTIEIHIFQDFQPKITIVSMQDITKVRLYLEEVLNNIAIGHVEYKPSRETCFFCPANNGHCAAQLEDLNKIDPFFDDFPQAAVEERDLKLARSKDYIMHLIKEAESRIIESLQDDAEYEDFYLDYAKPHRKWKDEEKARKLLIRRFKKTEAIVEKLISPSRAEALIKRNKMTNKSIQEIDELIEIPEKDYNKPILKRKK